MSWSLTVGQRWRQDLFPLPTDVPTFGWHFSGEHPLLVVGDPDGVLLPEMASHARLELGFAAFGPLAVVMLRSQDWPFLSMDSPRPYLDGDDAPEVQVSDGHHLLWTMAVVSQGVVTALRAFTASPEVTVWLRRRFAEQRARGPVSFEESDVWISRWQELTETEAALWSMAQVTCHAGD